MKHYWKFTICLFPSGCMTVPWSRRNHRYVCWHKYGRSSAFGDNVNQIDAPRVQIDIHTQSTSDTLVEDVCAALWMMDLPYSIESEGYDDDYADLRTILQLVVI